MVEISKRNARTWSRMGIRATYGQALSIYAAENPNVIALSADLGRSSGLDRFSKEYPGQFINTGIAEQNMVGVAAGLARSGFDVFASTFAPFASMRASEQVRMNMGYMQEPVKLVALGSGFAMGFLGNSHYGLEDLAVMRAIPGLTVVSPADCAEIYKTLEACIGYPKPVYIRLTGAVNCPVVYEEDYEFKLGKAVWLKPAADITVVSAGSTVGHCLQAANALAEEGLTVGLLNMHTIKPLDTEALAYAAARASILIVVEEHMRAGGLGSAVLEHFADVGPPSCRVARHGIADRYGGTGTYSYLLKISGLDADGIAEVVKREAGNA
ncbi:MAG: transketolase [Afipia felis]|nr:transketolase [Afipia felis]